MHYIVDLKKNVMRINWIILFWITQACYTDRLLENYVADNVVEVISGFFSHSQFGQTPAPQTKSYIFKKLYAKMIQLYRCAWVSESQKSKILNALNSMQEKATFMGVSDMPLVRNIEATSTTSGNSLQASVPVKPIMFDALVNEPVFFATDPRVFASDKTNTLKTKHDTRIVNEAFQDTVVLLEEGFSIKMQAEMLVLVDVLHKPASIFAANSNFRLKSQDKRFIAKLINHAKYLRDKQENQLCIKLLQILREMIPIDDEVNLFA